MAPVPEATPIDTAGPVRAAPRVPSPPATPPMVAPAPEAAPIETASPVRAAPRPGTLLQKRDRHGELRCECTVEEGASATQGSYIDRSRLLASGGQRLGPQEQNPERLDLLGSHQAATPAKRSTRGRRARVGALSGQGRGAHERQQRRQPKSADVDHPKTRAPHRELLRDCQLMSGRPRS